MPGAGRQPYLKGEVGGASDPRLVIRHLSVHNAGERGGSPRNRLGGTHREKRLRLAGFVTGGMGGLVLVFSGRACTSKKVYTCCSWNSLCLRKIKARLLTGS